MPAASAHRPVQPRRRHSWLIVALAALAVLLGSALLLRVRAPIEAAGAVHAPVAVASVFAAQAGLLVQVLAQPGQAVVADQVLAQLATAPFEAELQLRWQAFLELQGELATEEAGLRDASAATLAHAAQRLVQAQSALAAASVRAPCAGHVEAVVARPGSLVGSGQPLLHLAPLGAARSLIAYLPAEERPFVQPGALARVELQAADHGAPRSAEAQVTHIAPGAATPEELRATLPAARPGAFLRLQLELRDTAPELMGGLRSGERITVHLLGREQRLWSALLGSVSELLAPEASAPTS